MKRVIYACVLFITILSLSTRIYATTNPSDKHEFKSTDREINFDVERMPGSSIALYFQSSVFNSYDEIIVERSGADNGTYSVCKTIEVNDAKISGDYFKTSDNYPLPAQRDCYYRVKTIGKDGSMKTFPPVLLEALSR